jgi:catechol 2,3-dioxygenase-like lactoylglutathione lyase family enzyme
MTIAAVDHVQLSIPPGRAGTARAFYETLLGLPELRDPVLDRPGTLRYRLGAQRLDLAEGASHVRSAPQAHLALQVSGLAALAARLEAARVPVERAPLHDRDRVYVDDPFGNRLELIATVEGRQHG